MRRSFSCATKKPCVQLLNSFCQREMWRQLNSWFLCMKFLVSETSFLLFSFIWRCLWILRWCVVMIWFHGIYFICNYFEIWYIFDGCTFGSYHFYELLACCCSVIMTLNRSKLSDADVSLPRYVRVNTLKLDVDSVLLELQEKYSVFWHNISSS